MAPFTFNSLTTSLIALGIGFCFGFTLERSGFGNARILAAQFYFYNMRVFKVMFTAIITAMVLIFLFSSLGLLNFELVWVPPTYFGPAIVGGLILGFGFIIGGYCPGTSLVSMSTLKVDALFFVLGLMVGMFFFAESISYFWSFWHQKGFMGRLTIFDMIQVDAGIMTLIMFVGAIACFYVAEKVETFFGGASLMPEPTKNITRFKKSLVALGALLCLIAIVIGQPDLERKMKWIQADTQKTLKSRSHHIDAGELLTLMHNPQVRLYLFDARDEKDYNLFHLLESKRISVESLDLKELEKIPHNSILVIMSNDEKEANRMFSYLSTNPKLNLYVLAGGINRWLDIFKNNQSQVPLSHEAPGDDKDAFRHEFEFAQGDKNPLSRPELSTLATRSFTKKVKILNPVKELGQGCG